MQGSHCLVAENLIRAICKFPSRLTCLSAFDRRTWFGGLNLIVIPLKFADSLNFKRFRFPAVFTRLPAAFAQRLENTLYVIKSTKMWNVGAEGNN